MNSYAEVSGNDCGEFEMGVDYQVTDEGGGTEAATNEADEPACKRAKMQLTVPEDMLVLRQKILEHKLLRLKNVREKCTEQLMELYYLQAGGNMMEYNAWRKRPPAPQLVAFLEARRPAGPEAATSAPAHDEVVEKARQEAYVARRVAELARAGLWAERRLPRVMEPPRPKTHWDYLLEEMAWLAQDFAHERKWKKQAAKKCAKAVQKYFQDKAMAAQKAEKAQELQLKKIAAFAAKEIRTFWANVEKVVEWKRTRRVEKARKEALDEQLSYMVDRSEKYSRQLAAKLHRAPDSDSEFTPRGDSDDDEETIDEQERAERPQRDELDTLKRESQKDIADLLPPGYTPGAPSPPPSDYSGHEDDADDETTIEAQERAEEVDHDEEIKRLQDEAEMSVDELRKRYCGDAPTVSSATPTDIDDEEDEDDESGTGSESESESSAESDSSRLESLVEGKEKKEQTDQASGEAGVQAAASIAATLQPTGTTLSETSVGTPVPMLLKHTLREYQHVGLHWLATMHSRQLNGILADEMGLGKTIQTIALLAHLAVDHGDWGPHLVIAPTSVVLNWECEFKKWCPAFKILTYYGSIKERKLKRVGWTKANYFHICITSYKLVVQDHQSFRRKRWKYLILDEAQNIKNFKSQRWQLLLNFQTERRLLLTGTPLQNSLLELWSLMHFLMPGVFASQSEFKEWFTPVAGIAAGAARHDDALVRRLHEILRPFLLRRLKADVERQMPRKYEHVLLCRLAKRQRALYDDFMSRAQTKSSLASGNLLSVINVLMQLRKVCNHPDLFEPRPVSSPLQLEALNLRIPALVLHTGVALQQELAARLGGALCDLEASGAAAFPAHRARHLAPPRRGPPAVSAPRPPPSRLRLHLRLVPRTAPPAAAPPRPLTATGAPLNTPAPTHVPTLTGPAAKLEAWHSAAARRVALENERRCWRLPLYGSDLRACVAAPQPLVPPPLAPASLGDLLTSLHDLIDRFTICWESARAPSPELVLAAPLTTGSRRWRERVCLVTLVSEESARPLLRLLHMPTLRQRVAFPHPRLLQYDCGKLQTLDELLRRLKRGSHRVLIFTQMTRVLDVLEAFLSMHGHTYLRLDGATKVEARQALVERFNADARVFCMILSTRSGGVGLNLTGADCVVFYDSDWNPTMDAQAQDRCHRIGQTRDVHVYRLVTAATVEENILRKAEQKRALGHLAIEDGHFTTSYLKTGSIEELFGATVAKEVSEARSETESSKDEDASVEKALAAAEDEADAAACVAARQEAQQDLAEFDETQPLDEAPNVPQDQDEVQLAQLMKQLTPVEKYAMRVVESSADAHEAEQAALEEMKKQLQEWEQARRALREPTPPSLTYPRGQMEDWVTDDGCVAPTWGPPTPPAGIGDVYVGRWGAILYRGGAVAEHRLPAVTRAPAPARRRPVRAVHAPSSLFERGGRVRGRTRPPRDPAPPSADWTPPEDTALRRALRLQRLPPDPSPATTPNWEWCADLVNDVSRQFRGPRAVRDRHDTLAADPDRARRKHKKAARRSEPTSELRPPLSRMEALRDAAERRRRAPRRRYDEPPADAARHSALLTDQGIVYDSPPTPMEVAARRADRIAKEKLKSGGATPATSVASSTPAPQRVVVAATKPDVAAPRRPTPPAPQLHLYRQQAFARQHLKILHHTTQGGPAVASTSEATVSTAVRGATPRRPPVPPAPRAMPPAPPAPRAVLPAPPAPRAVLPAPPASRAAPPLLVTHLSPAQPPDSTHH